MRDPIKRLSPLLLGVLALGLPIRSDSADLGVLAGTPCDVADARCQAQLARWVALTTGVRNFEAPRIRARIRAPRAHPDPSDADETDEPLVSSGVRSVLVRLGLLDGSAAPLTRGAMFAKAGAYRRTRREIVLFLPEEQRRTATGDAVLAHELIHAAQDRAGLLTRPTLSLDAELAWRARLEGEAVARSHRLKALLEGLNPAAIGWTAMFRHGSQAALKRIAKAKAPLAVAVATLPYMRGALWFDAVGADAAAWPEQFGDLLAEPPGARRTQATPIDLPGCRHDSERLGALALLAFLLPGTAEPGAKAAAETLLADRLCLEADGSFAWHLTWRRDATSADHVALVARRAARLGLAALQQSGSSVTLSGR